MIRIEINDREVLAALNRLTAAGADLRPALQHLGEYLIESTKRRFAEGRAPDGTPWAPNKRATIEHMLYQRSGKYSKIGVRTGTKKGYFDKKGRLAGKGRDLVMGKHPGIGESRRLSSEIHYRATGSSLEVGSALEYSGVFQIGAPAGKFGRTRRGALIPWGDVPPRPFLGLSDTDRQAIGDILHEYLQRALGRTA